MAPTYLQLRDKVARTLQDPDKQVFNDDTIKDMIAAAWAEISLVEPERFQEDLDPVDDQTDYALRADAFPDGAPDEVELLRVEVWGSANGGRSKALRQIEPASAHPAHLSYSQAGWTCWNGTLSLPDRWIDYLNGHADDYSLRVWGYSPWPALSADDDVSPLGPQAEEDLVMVCGIEALKRLISNRALFTQWQTRSNNTDVTPAALMNDLNIASEEWRRRSRQRMIVREAP